MIRRYTTPYHYFVLPFVVDEIDKINLVYTQNGEVITTKSNNDIVIYNIDDDLLNNASMGEDFYNYFMLEIGEGDGYSVFVVRLTQEETSKFTFYKAARKNIALAQIHILSTKGDAFKSRPIQIRIYGSTTEGEI